MNRNDKKRIEAKLQESLGSNHEKTRAVSTKLRKEPVRKAVNQFNIRLSETDLDRLGALSGKWELNQTATIRRLIMEAFFKMSQKGEV